MFYLLSLGGVLLFLSVIAWRDDAATAKRVRSVEERRRQP